MGADQIATRDVLRTIPTGNVNCCGGMRQKRFHIAPAWQVRNSWQFIFVKSTADKIALTEMREQSHRAWGKFAKLNEFGGTRL